MMSNSVYITKREFLIGLGVFAAAAAFFIGATVWGSSIGNEIAATTHLKATSTVQATGNIIGYADLLVGGTTTAGASVDVAFGGAAGTHADVYVSGGLGVGNATTSDGDLAVGNDFAVYNNGRVAIGATTTPVAGLSMQVTTVMIGSASDATNTLSIMPSSTTKGSCIELIGNAGAIHKLFINAAGNGVTVEAGAC